MKRPLPLAAPRSASMVAAGILAAMAIAPAHAQVQSNAIQPETTITLNGTGKIDAKPDVAMINVGVMVEATTASAAMTQQATKMNGVFSAVKASGVADRDMQTGQLSLNPVYDYPKNGQAKIRGYQATNELTIKVRDLKNLGKTLDATVGGGGNTISGISFSVDKPEAMQNEARAKAIQDAAAKAELYAKAVGYRVKRIVTISEMDYHPPQPVMMRMQAMNQAAEATPIAEGEVSLSANVNVVFELTK